MTRRQMLKTLAAATLAAVPAIPAMATATPPTVKVIGPLNAVIRPIESITFDKDRSRVTLHYGSTLVIVPGD